MNHHTRTAVMFTVKAPDACEDFTSNKLFLDLILNCTIYFVCMRVCLHVCTCTRSEEGVESPGAGVRDGYVPPCVLATDLWSSTRAASILNH